MNHRSLLSCCRSMYWIETRGVEQCNKALFVFVQSSKYLYQYSNICWIRLNSKMGSLSHHFRPQCIITTKCLLLWAAMLIRCHLPSGEVEGAFSLVFFLVGGQERTGYELLLNAAFNRHRKGLGFLSFNHHYVYVLNISPASMACKSCLWTFLNLSYTTQVHNAHAWIPLM